MKKSVKEKIAYGRWSSFSGKLLNFILFAGLLGLAVYLTVYAILQESILLGVAAFCALLIDWFFFVHPWWIKKQPFDWNIVKIGILLPFVAWFAVDRDTWRRRGSIVFGFLSMIVCFLIGGIISIESFNSPDWATRVAIILVGLIFAVLGICLFVRQLKHLDNDIELRE